MSNTKEIAFKISISAKDAENNIKNVTSNIVLLEDNLKQLEAIANDADLGAAQFEELANEIGKTIKAETILTQTNNKAGDSIETLGSDVNETDEKFKKLELQIRETRIALQKAEEAGDKLTFNKLKGDLDELEDKLEATKLKSKQLDDVLVDLPGPLGGVGQALKGLDAGFKLLIANPIVAILAGVVGVLALLKKSLSSTAEGQETLNRLSAAFGKILGPIMATIEAVAIPLFEFFADVLEKVGKGFSYVAKAVGISSDKIKEASINSSEALKKADDAQKKRDEEAKKASEDKAKDAQDKAKQEKDRLQKLNDDRKAAHEKEKARLEQIKKQKQDQINLNENIKQSEIELARSTIIAGDDVIANLKLKDAQREEDFQREKKRIEDLLLLEKKGSDEAKRLQIELNNLIASNNKEQNATKKEIKNEEQKEEKRVADVLADINQKVNDQREKDKVKQDEEDKKARSLAQTKIDLAIKANDEEFNSNEGNFEKQRELLDKKQSLLKEEYDYNRQFVSEDQEAQLLLEAQFNENQKQLTDARITIGKKEVDARDEQFAQIADILSQAASLAGDETNAGKALASASAAISTGLAISKALASSAPPLNFIQAALVGVAGLKNIEKINSVQVPKPTLKTYASGGLVIGEGTGTSDSIPAYLSNGESVINARSTAIFKPLLSAINTVGGGKRFASGGVVGDNSLSSQELLTNQLINFNNQNNQPIKTYVVSTDMSSAQQFDRVQRERSTI
jgi:hypothetical protein